MQPESSAKLRRKLGVAAVAAIVAGDMLGSGIFFTPGELASVASRHWQVYFFWALAGGITLCGALTLAEMSSQIPESASTFYIIREAYGPFWGFLKFWTELWIGGPVSVAGVAIVFGQFCSTVPGIVLSPQFAAVCAILFFTIINLMGVQWGGGTQTVLTAVKIGALLGLVFGSILLAAPLPSSATVSEFTSSLTGGGIFGALRVMGLGVATVLFTYDGWIDVTHAAGEVAYPARNLPRGLSFGVGSIIVLYLLVNYAFLRVVPLTEMRAAPTLVASNVASQTFGHAGGSLLTALIIVSILGSMGGLIMTIPRLYFGVADQYERTIRNDHPVRFLFDWLSRVSSRTSVPVGAIIFSAAISCIAVLSFGSFGRLANFLVVPLQLINILLVASIFRLRPRNKGAGYRTPGYPVVPLIYIVVMGIFLISAVYFNPVDTLMGIGIMSTAVPIYFWLNKRKGKMKV